MSTTVLLVDDHRIVLEAIQSLLEASGEYRVVGTAADGRAGAELALRLRPDVTVMDVQMRGLNGIEATRKICAAEPDMRVVALSSTVDGVRLTRMLRAGAVGYVVKDDGVATLVQAMRAAVRGQFFFSEDALRALVCEVRRAGSRELTAFDVLTPLEREILQLVAEGQPTADIAPALHLKRETIARGLQQIRKKISAGSIAELTKLAIREGITDI